MVSGLPPVLDTMAQDAYEAYNRRLTLVATLFAQPPWGTLAESERDAWRDVVRAVMAEAAPGWEG